MGWKIPARSALIPWGLLVLGFIVLILWLRFAPPDASWSPRRILGAIMPEPKVITRVEKVIVPGPERIKIVPKKVIVDHWHDLPVSATVANENAVVTAVCEIPPSPEGGTAISVLETGADNVATGRIEYQQKPTKFLQVKRAFYAEAYWLPVGDRQAEAALGVNPMRLGPVEVKAKAGIDLMRDDSTIKGFVAVGGEIRF